jgi:hypothetical protein
LTFFVVVLLTAAQGIGLSGLNQPPSETTGGAAAAAAAEVTPAKDFYAVVSSDGTLVRGRGAVSVERVNVGAYHVVFFRKIRTCAWVATVGSPGTPVSGAEPGGQVSVAAISGTPQGIEVITFDNQGRWEDRGFHLQVSC